MSFFLSSLFDDKPIDKKFKKKKIKLNYDFDNRIFKDYWNHKPGSEMWMKIWKKYPELQDEMLLFRRKKCKLK